MQTKQASLKHAHTSKLIMGPGQEADDIKAIQVQAKHATVCLLSSARCYPLRRGDPERRAANMHWNRVQRLIWISVRDRPHGSRSRIARTRRCSVSSPNLIRTRRSSSWRRPSRTWMLLASRCVADVVCRPRAVSSLDGCEGCSERCGPTHGCRCGDSSGAQEAGEMIDHIS